MNLKEKKEIIKNYLNKSILTIYGPSTVIGLTSNGQYVELLEMDEDSFLLSFEDFLLQLKEYN